MSFRILLSALPIVVFFALSRVAEPWLSILGGFTASSLVLFVTRGNRLIASLTAFGFAVVTVTAALGIALDSEKAYLASGPISDLMFPFLYLWSIRQRRPLIGEVAWEMFPALTRVIPKDAKVFMLLSLVWAAFDVVHGTILGLLLRNLSVTEYIIWSRVIGWPLTGALVGISAIVIYREALRRRA